MHAAAAVRHRRRPLLALRVLSPTVPKTSPEDFPMAERRKRAENEYRAKAFECLSLAESTNDPERRADAARSY
jgi:hypothetical protein